MKNEPNAGDHRVGCSAGAPLDLMPLIAYNAFANMIMIMTNIIIKKRMSLIVSATKLT